MKYALFLCTLFTSTGLIGGPKKKPDQPEIKVEMATKGAASSAPQTIPQPSPLPPTPYPSPSRTICIIGTALPCDDQVAPSLEALLAKDFERKSSDEATLDDADADNQSENCDLADQIEYMFEHPEERE